MRIPVAPIGDGRNLPKMDHFALRGSFVEGPGGFVRPRPPYLLEKTAQRPFGPAPKLGEHTDEVTAERKTTARGTADGEGGGTLPLGGLRVVELSTFWAGPIAGWTLAAMGADVVKVESIQRPDGMRFAGAIPTDRLWAWSPIFAGVNPGVAPGREGNAQGAGRAREIRQATPRRAARRRWRPCGEASARSSPS